MFGYPVRDEIFNPIKTFINSIDKPGAILALYDEGKIFARAVILNYEETYGKMLEYIFNETQHIKVRVGGYSDRIAYIVEYMVGENPQFANRVEHIRDYTKDIVFDKNSDFIKRTDEYDFKGFGGHTCVYYYVNGIESGFTDKDGVFQPFYQAKDKGHDAIDEVIMAIGYNDIPPATAAVHTYSTNSSGDMLIFGGQTTQKKCRGLSRQQLFEEYKIPYLDIFKLLPPKEILYKYMDEAQY